MTEFTAEELDSLFFQIRCVFLLPRPLLPTFERFGYRLKHRRALMQTVHDALVRFGTCFGGIQASGIERCERMLRCMVDAEEPSKKALLLGGPRMHVLRRQMAELEDNGTPSQQQSRYSRATLPS
jgi:hypothetical protein